MSSFDTTREQWELYHREERDKVKEAAEKGDPESDTVVRITVFHSDGKWPEKYTMEKGSKQEFSSPLVDVGHKFTLELVC